ncbi:MAG: protein kinase [Chloroflexi bacterium]|nr:protein kinase [Chloroflexota bacterium]
MSPPPPLIQNRYRLAEHLGKGGMATVYRAVDTTLNRDVAIKLVAATQHDPRFMREAQATAQLNHPHIVTLFDLGTDSGWHYLILEYVAGIDLKQHLSQGPLPLSEVLAIGAQLSDALAYAHSRGFTHRDIKPANILMTPHGAAKLADFGLTLSADEERITADDHIVGTLLYMPPEALTQGTVDHRSDLYALGVVLYEMLTGFPPFADSNSSTAVSNILNHPPPPPQGTHLPDAVEALIMRLLAKNPTERFHSAAEVQETLVRLQTGVHDGRPPASDSIEAERRRMAVLLNETVITQIELLLTQAHAFQQTTRGSAANAIAVLVTLAQQAAQSARDLESRFAPATLDTLGLEPALEALAAQEQRMRGLDVRLSVQRLDARLPTDVELALYRTAQDVLEQAAREGHASRVYIQLRKHGHTLTFTLSDDGHTAEPHPLPTITQRVERMGATLLHTTSEYGGLEIAITLDLAPPPELSERETEVLQLVASGMTNKAIATELYISPRTVKFHLDNAFNKLGVNTRTEAAVLAVQYGLIEG